MKYFLILLIAISFKFSCKADADDGKWYKSKDIENIEQDHSGWDRVEKILQYASENCIDNAKKLSESKKYSKKYFYYKGKMEAYNDIFIQFDILDPICP